MDKERAKQICEGFGRPVIMNEDGKPVATIARADMSHVERIENMDDEELISSALGLSETMIYCVGISDIQKLLLYEQEISERGLGKEYEEKYAKIERYHAQANE